MTPIVVELRRGHQNVAINVFGATLTSWKANGEEQIFVSKAAVLDGSKAIRGGIPVVFPQFGTGPLISDPKRQHGFARDLLWSIESTRAYETVFLLLPDEFTRRLYPFEFELRMRVELLEDGLVQELIVKNVDSKEMPFTCLLHTYFAVDDVKRCVVKGLDGLTFKDKLSGQQLTETQGSIHIASEVDRQYFDVPKKLRIECGTKVITLEHSFRDAVLWNPWIEKSKTLSNFVPDEYAKMLCLELGQVSEVMTLLPGAVWRAKQHLVIKQ